MGNNSTSFSSPPLATASASKLSPASRALRFLVALAGALLVAFIFAALGTGVYVTANGGHPPRHPSTLATILVGMCAELPLVPYLLIVVPRILGQTLRELGFRPLRLREIGIAALGAVAMIIIVDGLASLLASLFHIKSQQTPVQMLQEAGTGGTLLLFVIFATVIAPIIEELFFRVFVFNAGRGFLGIVSAALLSGLLFGAAHFQAPAGPFFLTFFVPLALGGMILCYVYYASANAYASMVTHGLFNSATVSGVLLARFAPHAAHLK